MSEPKLSRLRFNFGYLLDAPPGSSREIELDYPSIKISGDLTLTPLQGAFRADRTAQGIYFRGELISSMEIECTRCLIEARIPITIDIDEHFYYPASTAPEGEYTIPESAIVDLAPLVRELAFLAVPISPVCRPDCNGLCMECGFNLNEGDCGCEPEHIDPRLAILQQLLHDQND
jgi:uncharacterized protein